MHIPPEANKLNYRTIKMLHEPKNIILILYFIFSENKRHNNI